MRIGLRVDVDTLRGTARGVPALLRILGAAGVPAAFFFSVGPDNMGRHLWRLLKPAFLWKMLRTGAPGLYGPDIILQGTLWPGRLIGRRCADVIRACARAGHEIGVHAWDHHAWQARSDRMDAAEIGRDLARASGTLERIVGRPPDCSAVPGWKCTGKVLREKEKFNFRYNSDCRGRGIYLPEVDGVRLKTPQIALNLPTFDEVLGRNGVTRANYNRRLLAALEPGSVNLLTIHAECEGGVCQTIFEQFLALARAEGHEFVRPGDLLPADHGRIPVGHLVPGRLPGREGTVAFIS